MLVASLLSLGVLPPSLLEFVIYGAQGASGHGQMADHAAATPSVDDGGAGELCASGA